jgi:hypothetical protein
VKNNNKKENGKIILSNTYDEQNRKDEEKFNKIIETNLYTKINLILTAINASIAIIFLIKNIV